MFYLLILTAIVLWVRSQKLGATVHFFMGRGQLQTGGERYNFECMKALRLEGYPVKHHWVSPYRSATLVGLLPNYGGLLSSPLVALVLAWRRGLFVVDEHFLDPLLVTNFIRYHLKLGKLTIIVHHLEDDHNRLRSAFRSWRFRYADRVIAVSRYTRQELLAIGVPFHKIELIHPGFAPSPVRQKVTRSGALRCLVVGRCEVRKGWENLLLALPLLESGLIELVFVGEIDTHHFRSLVAPLVSQHGLEGRVRFTGRVSQEALEELFAQADILVHPSHKEGFGIVLLEALHWGLPVLSSQSSAIPELIEHGHDGWLCPSNSPEDLAEGLSLLATDELLLKSLSNKGQAKAASYSWPQTGSKFVEAVRPLLRGTTS